MILSVYTGINHTVVDNSLVNYITSPINFDYGLTGNFSENVIVIFIQNIVYCLYTVLMGLSLSLLSILIVVSNEIAMGNVFEFNNLFHMINDVFVLVASFLLSKIELRFIGEITTLSLNNVFSRIKVPLKDLILTLTIILIFVLMISIIEPIFIV